MSTTFMNLSLPTPTVTLGPAWASQLNAAIETIDSHDHTSGKGSTIPTSGLNIDEDLDFQQNKPFNLLSTQYISNASTLTGATNARSVYVSSGNLFYTNTSGTAVQITDGGSIVSTPAAVQSFELQNISSDIIISPSDTFVFIAVDTTATRSITLPLANSVAAGRIYIVKDVDGMSFDNIININAAGSDTIDGLAVQPLHSYYGSWQIVGDGVDKWFIS